MGLLVSPESANQVWSTFTCLHSAQPGKYKFCCGGSGNEDVAVGLEYPRVKESSFVYLHKALYHRVRTNEYKDAVESSQIKYLSHIISMASFIAVRADSRASWTISSAARTS